MEPFAVCVRRWAEDTWSFLARLATDPRGPPDIQAEARRRLGWPEEEGDDARPGG
jgi:hypothetical protein